MFSTQPKTTYFDLNSENRDRNNNPNPSNFEIPSRLSENANNQYFDPICNSAPEKVWNPDAFSTYTNTSLFPLNSIFGVVLSNSENFIRLNIASTEIFQSEEDYYTGTIITFNNNIFRRITSFTKILSNIADIKIDRPLPDQLIATINWVIIDPTLFPIRSVFVPNGMPEDHYYHNYFLYNEDNQDYKKIVHYSGETRLLSIGDSLSSWSNISPLCIRKELPYNTYQIATATSTLYKIDVISTDKILIENYYIRVLAPRYGEYKKNYLNANEMKRVIRTEYPNPGIISFYLESPLLESLSNPLYTKVELLPITKDNLIPYGSVDNSVANNVYEVKLLSLTIPKNKYFQLNYSHLYVKIVNTKRAKNRFNFLGNSQNLSGVVFKVTLSPPQPFENFKSITYNKFTSDGIEQLLVFDLHDNITLTLLTPDGQVLQPQISDSTSPVLPIKYLQISCLFSLRKL